jgi:diguanylate cyclase (GGDEF)-like protein
MRTQQHNKLSTYLIVLSAVVLSLGIIMSYLVYLTVQNLKYDAGLINQAGVVRGSIQRVTKLVLADADVSAVPIVLDINRLLERFVAIENGFTDVEVDETVFNGVQEFRQKWRQLEEMLIEYTASPSPRLRQKIIRESEACWQAADAIVLAVQQANEAKVAGIKLFYIILFVNAASAAFIIWLIIFYVRKILEYESSHDPLTHIRNRRSYEKTVDSEINRSLRYEQPLSLVMFDVDCFKDINDELGHKAGDAVLVEIAGMVERSVRTSDSVFRMGGDEFSIIIPGVELEGVLRLAEKIRRQVAGQAFVGERKITLSLGVAEFLPETTKDDLYRNADKALYLAKNRGRNNTVVFSSDAAAV